MILGVCFFLMALFVFASAFSEAVWVLRRRQRIREAIERSGLVFKKKKEHKQTPSRRGIGRPVLHYRGLRRGGRAESSLNFSFVLSPAWKGGVALHAGFRVLQTMLLLMLRLCRVECNYFVVADAYSCKNFFSSVFSLFFLGNL